MDKPDELARVRQQRQAVYKAAVLLNDLPGNASEEQYPLDMGTLLSVPDWCYWPEEQRLALVSTAGALFLVPVMRLWIDAERIKTAMQILGEPLFEAVMEYEQSPQAMAQPPEDLPVDDLFLSTGASVLLGALPPALQRRISALLPRPGGQIPQPIATQLAAEAQVQLLRLTAEYVAAQEAKVSG